MSRFSDGSAHAAACARDVAPLVCAVGALTAAARFFGFASSDYYRFGAVFFLFLIPGWCLVRALRLEPAGAGAAERLPCALFVSYVAYATLALACRAAGLGFFAFTCAFAIVAAAALAAWARSVRADAGAGAGEPAVASPRGTRLEDLLVVASVIVLSAAVFAFPYSEDQGIWDFNVLESLERRSFEPSALDVAPFGLREAQPRMQANLFHSFFALAGWAADVSPRVLAYYAAAPFLGCFLFLALALFVRTISGAALGRPLALLAVLAPWSLFYRAQSSYFYEFRVLNSPTLDKDFATFFLLPVLLVLAWRFLTEGRRRDLALAVVAMPATIWSHPVGPIYFFIATGALVFAAFERGRAVRCAAVAACALAALLVCQATIDPSSTHDDIEDLARLDSVRDPTHFWPGHYVTKERHEQSSVVYWSDDRPVFRPRQFFASALTHFSALLGIAWAALRLVRHLAGVGPPPLSASTAVVVIVSAGLAAASAAVLWIERAGAFVTMRHFQLGAAAAALALLASLAPAVAAWRARERDGADGAGRAEWPAEDVAMRVQTVYVALLVLLYVVASLVLGGRIELYRGLERLHWVYFGFFPFAFVGFYACRALAAAVVFSVPSSARDVAMRSAAAFPLAFLIVHAADQARAMHTATPAALSRAGVARSAVDAYVAAPIADLRRLTALAVFQADGDRGAAAPLERPSWLLEDDVTLYLTQSYFHYRLGPHLYAIMKQAAYYRELYSESFALERLGDRFLTSFHAYNDAVDGRVTSLLLHWLRARRVTIIVGATPELAAALQDEWPEKIERINANTYRIAAPRPRT